jgi:hypothetical protein
VSTTECSLFDGFNSLTGTMPKTFMLSNYSV